MYLIKNKLDVFPIFKDFKARVELEFGKRIKCLRTNNEGEHTNKYFLTFCKHEAI